MKKFRIVLIIVCILTTIFGIGWYAVDRYLNTNLEDERARKIAEKENEKELHDKEVASISQKYDRKIERLKDKVDNVQREVFERIGLGRAIYRDALKNAPIRNRDDEK